MISCASECNLVSLLVNSWLVLVVVILFTLTLGIKATMGPKISPASALICQLCESRAIDCDMEDQMERNHLVLNLRFGEVLGKAFSVLTMSFVLEFRSEIALRFSRLTWLVESGFIDFSIIFWTYSSQLAVHIMLEEINWLCQSSFHNSNLKSSYIIIHLWIEKGKVIIYLQYQKTFNHLDFRVYVLQIYLFFFGFCLNNYLLRCATPLWRSFL